MLIHVDRPRLAALPAAAAARQRTTSANTGQTIGLSDRTGAVCRLPHPDQTRRPERGRERKQVAGRSLRIRRGDRHRVLSDPPHDFVRGRREHRGRDVRRNAYAVTAFDADHGGDRGRAVRSQQVTARRDSGGERPVRRNRNVEEVTDVLADSDDLDQQRRVRPRTGELCVTVDRETTICGTQANCERSGRGSDLVRGYECSGPGLARHGYCECFAGPGDRESPSFVGLHHG